MKRSLAISRYFSGLLLGSIVGLIGAMLVAPKKGSEFRAELTEGIEDLLNQVDDLLEVDHQTDNSNSFTIGPRVVALKDFVSKKAVRLTKSVSARAAQVQGSLANSAHHLSDLACQVKDKAEMLTEQMKSVRSSVPSAKPNENQRLFNNYMGHGSGPLYMPGAKADPDSSATSMSDPHSTYTANQPGAAGG